MDLIFLILGLALVGLVVHLITTKIPMDPMFIWAIRLIVIIVVILYLLRRFEGSIPNML